MGAIFAVTKACLSSFTRITVCIEAKQERGIVRRVLESKSDVAEVKDLLMKITARIEAFLVSVVSFSGTD